MTHRVTRRSFSFNVAGGGVTTINGVRVIGAHAVEVKAGKVFIDGKEHKKEVDDGKPEVVYNITVEGNVTGSVTANGTVEVKGDVKGDVQGETVTIGGSVEGGVSSRNGHITITGDVRGGASSRSGSIHANEISGGATSRSGDVSSASGKKRRR
jgi:hypothetical protein